VLSLARSSRYGWAVLALASLAACGGASFQDAVYSDAHTRYRVGELPEAWRRVSAEGNDLAFTRPGMGTISVNSTCTEYEDVPLSALVNHLLFDTTSRRVLVDETVTLVGRGARHVLLNLELDGVPVQLELYVVRKDGCVFDLTHVRARTTVAEARQTFLAFVERFDVLRVGRP
jgi:hypothetical protein